MSIEVKEHERIWLEPAGAPDRCWCQDNNWGDEGVEYVLASVFESLMNEYRGLREAFRYAYESGTKQANLLREEVAKSHETISSWACRAEAAEAEVKRYRETLHMISAGHGSPIALANHTLQTQALASTGGDHHAE